MRFPVKGRFEPPAAGFAITAYANDENGTIVLEIPFMKTNKHDFLKTLKMIGFKVETELQEKSEESEE